MAVVVPIETKYNPRGVKVAIRNLDDFKSAVDKAGGGMRGFATVTGKVMQSVGTSISSAGQSMTRNVTLPIVGMGVAAGIAFNDVDEALDTVAARSGRTGDQLARLQDVTKTVASNATQDFATVGEVVGQLGGRFTASAKTIETFADKMLTLSRVSGTDAATATESVSTAMKALGIRVKDAGGFLDSLLVASQKSGVSVDALALSTAKAAPAFRTYGIEAEQAVGLIAAMEGAGIPTTRVVAGLNSAFKKFAEDGVKDIPKALDETLRKIRDMPDATKATSLAVEIFGSRVGVTLADSLRTGKINLDDLSAALENSAGALGTAAAAVEGPQEQFARLKNQIMLVAAEFFEALLPAIQAIIPYVQQAIDWFKGLDESQQKLAVIIGVVVAAMGPLLIIVGSLITAVGGFITVLGAISAPVLAVVAAIGLIVAAVVLLWNKSEAFRSAVISVWNAIKAAIQSAVEGIKRKLDENKDKIEAFKDALAVVWEFIQQYVIPAIAEFYRVYLTTLIKVIGFVIEKIIDWYGFLFDVGVALFNAGKKVWEFVSAIRDGLGKALDFIGQLPGRVLDALKGLPTLLVDLGRQMVQGLLDGAGSLLSNIGQFFLDKLPWWIVEPFKKALGIASPSKIFHGFGVNIGEGLIEGTSKKQKDVDAKFKELANTAVEGFREGITTMKDAFRDVRDGFTAMTAPVATYESALASADQRMSAFSLSLAGAKRVTPETATAFADLAGKIRDDLNVALDLAKDNLENVKGRFREFTSAIESSLSSAFSGSQIYSLMTNFGQSALDAINGQASRVGEFMTSVSTLIAMGVKPDSPLMQMVLGAGYEGGTAIANSLIGGGKDAIDKATAIADASKAQADALGLKVYDNYYKAGEDSAQAQVAGVVAKMDALSAADGPLQKIMDTIIRRMRRTLVIDVNVSQREFDVTVNVAKRVTETVTQVVQRIEARAEGGPVRAGQTYLVGEVGPELFVASSNGYIVPNNEFLSMSGQRSSGGVTIAPGAVQVVLNGGDPAHVEAVVNAAFEELVRELQRA